MNLKIIYHKHNRERKNIPPINSHILYFYELTFVLDGSLTYIVDNKVIELKTNDAIFIKYGQQRERKAKTSKTNYISFNFLIEEKLDFPTYLKNIIDNELKLAFLYYDEMISAMTSSTTKISNLLIKNVGEPALDGLLEKLLHVDLFHS